MAINSINTVTAAAAASTQTTTKTAEKASETTKKADSSKTRRVLTPGQIRLPIKQQTRPTTQQSLQS